MVILDVECYKNYFLAAFLHRDTGVIHRVEMLNDKKMPIKQIKRMMSDHTTVSFNGNHYDLLMLQYACMGASNAELKHLSDEIIKSNLPSYRVAQDFGVRVPAKWDHIDIIEVAPGSASLKIYGGRLGCQKMQDLPYDIREELTAEQAAVVSDYCGNDLTTTLSLFESLEQAIELRATMSDEYGVDLRSKSDAQIAEAVISHEMERITGVRPSRQEVDNDTTFQYQNPGIIEFKTSGMQKVFHTVLNTNFTLGLNGVVKIPAELRDLEINIAGKIYQMGIGGLHSTESQQLVTAEKGILADFDVASYYPSIILQQRLAPKSLGIPFLKVYQSLVTRRLAAKAARDMVTADTLKIVINGSFGKLGSKWSALYAPELLIQTTITGQLALLMLIEAFEEKGISVVSANTDGVVVSAERSQEKAMLAIAFDWELRTSYELERTDYKLLASRDVNNYLAIKPDGSIKGKGKFAPTGLSKNPDRRIVCEAVMNYLSKGIPLESTIYESNDIQKFVTVRKVAGGAIWRGQKLGRAVRFYPSTDVPDDVCIVYEKSYNMVPNSSGCRPLMDLPQTFPNDIDYQVFIDDATKLLCEVNGYGYS
jgi:DNA polymerase elongation subunit (family B)